MPLNAEPAFTSYEGSFPSVEGLVSSTEVAENPAMEIEEPCPICLNAITGDAFLDPCFHKFCYHCILQWAEMVFTHPSMQGETCLECPICKTRSSCIIHSLFLDTFKRHYLFGIPPAQNRSFPLSPAHYQRLYMYKNSLRTSVEKMLNLNVKSRRMLFRISGNANVWQWVQRELQALMQVEDVDLITQHVLGVLKHCEDKQRGGFQMAISWIDEMCDAIKPFLFENAETFCLELRMFISRGLNVEAYDLLVEEALRANTLKVSMSQVSATMDLNNVWADEEEDMVPSSMLPTELSQLDADIDLASLTLPSVARPKLPVHRRDDYTQARMMAHPSMRVSQLAARAPTSPNIPRVRPVPNLASHPSIFCAPTTQSPRFYPFTLPSRGLEHCFPSSGTKKSPIPISSDRSLSMEVDTPCTTKSPSQDDRLTRAPQPPHSGSQSGSGSCVNWKLHEILTLVEAKKDLDLRIAEGGLCVRMKDHWQTIADPCLANDVSRSKGQCKTKWEKVNSIFNRIHDYEERIPSGWSSYWQMNNAERRARGLPTDDFHFDVYEKMSQRFGGERNVDVSGLLVESVSDDTTTLGDEPGDINMEQQEGGDGGEQTIPQAPNVGSTVGSDASDDGSSGGLKRKRRARVNASTMKDLEETTKRLVTVYEDDESSRAKKEGREQERADRFMELEQSKVDMARHNIEAVCSSLNKIAESISTLAIHKLS